MTGWSQLSLRVQNALDRLAWGFGDLKRVLQEHGAWPASTSSAIAPDGGRWAVIGGRIRKQAKSGKATGLLMGESECLWGAVQLPSMPRKSLGGAVEEALWARFPLAARPDRGSLGGSARRQGGMGDSLGHVPSKCARPAIGAARSF